MLIVDTDPALGLRFRDIDDVLAILTLYAHGVPVVGLTTCFGNAPIDQTHPIGLALGRRLGIPVYRGAAHPGDIDTAAVEALCAHTGDVLAIGPCTNIAAALNRGARWRRLVLLGGTIRTPPNIRYLRLTELNFALDPAAANRAFSADIPVTLIPMEVCRTVVFTGADLQHLPPDLRAASSSWLSIAPLLTRTKGFHPWDVVAAFVLIDPSMFRCATHSYQVLGGRFDAGHLAPGPHRVEVVERVDVERLRGQFREGLRRHEAIPPFTPP